MEPSDRRSFGVIGAEVHDLDAPALIQGLQEDTIEER